MSAIPSTGAPSLRVVGDPAQSDLLREFEAAGSWYDKTAFAIQEYAGMGAGLVALRDVEVGETLFKVATVLTEDTSDLKKRLTDTEWESLSEGWARLILVLMWESHRGRDSRFWWYLETMPLDFNTPMHWSLEEQQWLKGTSIEGRIGRQDADELFASVIKPLIVARPDVFGPPEFYTLQHFHAQGSRILSRSFTLGDIGDNVDGDDGDSNDADDRDGVVAMVPLADMLNAAKDCDNAHLELVEGEYQMVTTAPIRAGRQIFNTYSSPPDAELLRKYGHLEQASLPDTLRAELGKDLVADYPYGNDGDEVDIEASLVLKVIQADGAQARERVEWWLEEAEMDDTFWVSFDDDSVEPLINFVRILTSAKDWQRAKRQGDISSKHPSRLDRSVVQTVVNILLARGARYTTPFEDDVRMASSAISDRAALAARVRLGERRVLLRSLRRWELILSELGDDEAARSAKRTKLA